MAQCGTPWTVICPESKVTSFQSGVTKKGDGFFTFSIKCSQNNMLINCTVFDEVSEEERKKPFAERAHNPLYLKARGIQKNAYYTVTGHLSNRMRPDGTIEVLIKVTDLAYAHDEMNPSASAGTWNRPNNANQNQSQNQNNNQAKPITFRSGFGR